MMLYVLLLSFSVLSFAKDVMNLCAIKKKTIETQGGIPTKVFRANLGLIYEIRQNGKWCYGYLSRTADNSTFCSDTEYHWFGYDGIGTAGIKNIANEVNEEELQQQLNIVFFDASMSISDAKKMSVNFTFFENYTSTGNPLKFYDVGRESRLVITKKEQIVLFIGLLSDDGNGKNGDVMLGVVDPIALTVKIQYSKNETTFSTTVTENNIKHMDSYGDQVIVGSPQSRTEKVFDLETNILVQEILDNDDPNGFPVKYGATTFIPPQKKSLYHLGEGVAMSNKYIMYSDPTSSRGVVFVARRFEGGKFDFRATANPFPRWGNFQNFGQFLRVVDRDDEMADVYIAAPTAWIHNDIRRSKEVGVKLTEIIGVVYHFELTNDKVMEAKNYYVVVPSFDQPIVNSTISYMINFHERVYITLTNSDGLYRLDCDDLIELHL